MFETTDRNGDALVVNIHGNIATIRRWESVLLAEISLESLIDSYDCTDCFGCWDVNGCYDCTDCDDCNNCEDCVCCTDCDNCTECNVCLGCVGGHGLSNKQYVIMH